MAAYKDEKRGTWYVSFYYEDWTGAKKRKVKRGFRTKKEALNFEAEYKRTAKADMDMTMGEFVEVYFRDKGCRNGSLYQCKTITAFRRTETEGCHCKVSLHESGSTSFR